MTTQVQAIQRTAYGALLQSCLYYGIPYPIIPNSTLNDALGINATINPAPTDVQNINYYAIGIGGSSITPGSGGAPNLVTILPHKSRDVAPYYQIPFVLRALTNDLTPTQVAGYRLRKIITIAGVQYAAYYIKAIDKTSATAELMYNSVSSGGVTTSTAFTPDSQDMAPIPPALDSSGVIISSADSISASIISNLTFSTFDITEILNVCSIMLSNPNYAVITEIAVCSGVDKTLTGTFNGSLLNYTEAVGVTVNSFMSTDLPLPFLNQALTLSVNWGATESLLAS